MLQGEGFTAAVQQLKPTTTAAAPALFAAVRWICRVADARCRASRLLLSRSTAVRPRCRDGKPDMMEVKLLQQ